jgi:flavin-dependent dehydrogenase
MTFSEPIRAAGASYDVIIIGGGLAGLVCSIELSRAGRRVVVLEKKAYPFHKVCGEYVSHEVLGYLQSLGFDPYEHGAARITRLRVSTPSGKNIYAPLSPGGFGLSRFVMDDALQSLAVQFGAQVITGARVTDVQNDNGRCIATTATGARFSALLTIGAWGKRDVLDKKLDRDFLKAHTGYLGVKYHIRADYPADEIGLDNFPGGYCGISKIEGDKYNLCYLYQRDYGGNFKTMAELEGAMLHRNPILKRIFTQSDFLLPQPEVINEISFSAKRQTDAHVLMCGDTAGLITPLCGNGMSMAIAAAKLLSEIILESGVLQSGPILPSARAALEQAYSRAWSRRFGHRLYWGRTIQRAFGAPRLSEIVLRFIHAIPAAERWLIDQTHGRPLDDALH